MHAHAAVILRNAWKVNEGEQTQPRMCRAMQTHSHAALSVIEGFSRTRGSVLFAAVSSEVSERMDVAEVGLAASWGEPDPGAGSPEGLGSLLEPVRCGWGAQIAARGALHLLQQQHQMPRLILAQGTHRAPRWKAATLES